MIIIHDIYGEVEGVELRERFPCGWFKGGASFCYAEGWREKVVERWKDERWEEDSGYLSEYKTRACLAFLAGGIRLPLPANKRWAVVERYALPENWRHRSINEGAENLTNWVEQFKRPCLIIERKVEE